MRRRSTSDKSRLFRCLALNSANFVAMSLLPGPWPLLLLLLCSLLVLLPVLGVTEMRGEMGVPWSHRQRWDLLGPAQTE